MKLTKSNARELTLIRALLHGDSGMGKTTSILTLPASQTLVACTERGTLPLRNKEYPVIPLQSWEDVEALVGLIYNAPIEKDGSLTVSDGEETVKGIKILVIDGLTGVGRLAAQQILTVDRKRVMIERTRGKREEERTDRPLGIYEENLTQEDYGAYGRKLENLLGALCNIPIHLVVTAQTRWDEDKRTGTQFRVPAVAGRIARECAGYFNLVFHMETQGESRVWRTANDGSILAKDATGTLPQFVETNWTKVFASILKQGKDGK